MPKQFKKPGTRYGLLTLVKRGPEFTRKSGRVETTWECKCECGATKLIRAEFLSSRTKSCGCLLRDYQESRKVDLSGRRFGRLIALDSEGQNIGGKTVTFWRCQCDCGKEKKVRMTSLTKGHTESCGCLAVDRCRERQTKHGQARTYHQSRAYKIWGAMKTRCYRKNHVAYHRYGGRGILVCDRWRDFENFYADMGDPPEGKMLERKDNNRGYCKKNCKWATSKEQGRNRVNTIYMIVDGVKKPMAEWADSIGCGISTLRERRRRGWSDDKIVKTPIRSIEPF